MSDKDLDVIAFPVVFDDPNNKVRHVHTGMTLRDYFAARAMEGTISGIPHDRDVDTDWVADWSYRMADAMMKARSDESQ